MPIGREAEDRERAHGPVQEDEDEHGSAEDAEDDVVHFRRRALREALDNRVHDEHEPDSDSGPDCDGDAEGGPLIVERGRQRVRPDSEELPGGVLERGNPDQGRGEDCVLLRDGVGLQVHRHEVDADGPGPAYAILRRSQSEDDLAPLARVEDRKRGRRDRCESEGGPVPGQVQVDARGLAVEEHPGVVDGLSQAKRHLRRACGVICDVPRPEPVCRREGREHQHRQEEGRGQERKSHRASFAAMVIEGFGGRQ